MGAAISWVNHVTNGYASAPIMVQNMTSASVDSAYPIANMIDPDPSKVVRVNYVNSSGSNKAVILRKHVSAANDKTFNVLALLNVRLAVGQWSSVTFGIFTSDLITGAIYGNYVPADVVPIPGTTDRYNLFTVIAGGVSGRAECECTITTATDTNSYLEVGHFWAGPALVWEETTTGGVSGNWRHGVVDPSDVERTRGGALVASKLPHRRTLQCEFDSKTYAQAMGTPGTAGNLSYRQFMAEAGNSSPVLVLPRTPLNPASPTAEELHTLQAQSLYASFIGQHEIGHLGGNLFRSTGNFEEIR